MNNKGIFIILDVLLAMSLLLYYLFASQNYLNFTNDSHEEYYIKQLGLDLSTALEKSDYLKDAISRNKTNVLRATLNELPANICANLEIYKSTNIQNSVMTVSKHKCNTLSEEYFVSYRSFVVSNSIYLEKLTLWYGE